VKTPQYAFVDNRDNKDNRDAKGRTLTLSDTLKRYV